MLALAVNHQDTSLAARSCRPQECLHLGPSLFGEHSVQVEPCVDREQAAPQPAHRLEGNVETPTFDPPTVVAHFEAGVSVDEGSQVLVHRFRIDARVLRTSAGQAMDGGRSLDGMLWNSASRSVEGGHAGKQPAQEVPLVFGIVRRSSLRWWVRRGLVSGRGLPLLKLVAQGAKRVERTAARRSLLRRHGQARLSPRRARIAARTV
jgi:hypothetical protein